MRGGEREVVKLSLGEGQSPLNVLPVGREGKVLTLVCPFPVLPVEVPVSVSMPGAEGPEAVAATINRVGVELMGEELVPRFKLQVTLSDENQTDDGSEIPIMVDEACDQLELAWSEADGTASSAPPIELDEPDEDFDISQASGIVWEAVDEPVDEPVDESVEVSVEDPAEESLSSDEPDEASPDADFWELEASDAEGDEEALPEAHVSWSAGEFFGLGAASHDGPMMSWADTGREEYEGADDEDPPWTGEKSMQRVHAALDDSRHRSTRWSVRMAVCLALIVSIFAVGYVMRQQIAPLLSPFFGDDLAFLSSLGGDAANDDADVLAAIESPAEPATPAEEPSEAAPVADATESEAAPVETAAEVSEEAENPAPTLAEAEPEAADSDEAVAPAVQTVAADDSATDPSVEATSDTLRVILPTRWPVSAARSYRLHDPTGIVVDIPGGIAAERARWIDTANERVRSVRVLERENGVRFIIYLNDEFVPRYRVGYNGHGVTVDILGPDSRHMSTK